MWNSCHDYNGDDCEEWRKQRADIFNSYNISKKFEDLISFCQRIQPTLTVKKFYSRTTQRVCFSISVSNKCLFERIESECINYLSNCDIHNIHRGKWE